VIEQAVAAIEGYERVLRILLPLYRVTIASGPSLSVGPRYERAVNIAHGWYVRCLRSVEALLLLEGGGLADEGSAIRRSVIEHIVALQWLVARGDEVVDTLAREHAKSGAKRLAALQDASWESIDFEGVAAELDAIRAEELDASQDFLLHFRQREQRFDQTRSLPLYLAETAISHPSYESANRYRDQATGEFLLDSWASSPQAPFCASELLSATMIFRQVFEPPPWDEELTEASSQFQTATDAARASAGLSPIDWDSLIPPASQ